MDIEGRLLSRVLRDRSWRPIMDARVTEEWFHDDEHREVFGFIGRHYVKHGEVPTLQLLRSSYPNYPAVKVEDSLEPLVEQLRERRNYGLTVAMLQEAGEHVEEHRDWRAALDEVQKSIQQILTESSTLVDVDLTKTWQDRLDKYHQRAANGGRLLGIPTGFKTIDLATSGWQPKQLVTVIATPKVGKSTLAMRMALNAWDAGYKVLFISFEMSNDEQEARHDAMLSGVSHTHYMRGTLDRNQLAHLEIELGKTEGEHSFVLSADINSVTTVSGIAAKIEQHKPDIVFVDGVYLMRDELGEPEGSPQALTNITRNLKRLGQRASIPIIASTQALLSKVNKRKGVQADSIGYCVDDQTEILTRRGWLRETELEAGDMAYALDHTSGSGVWSPVLAVNRFPAAPRRMLRLSGPRSGVDALATEQHRWPVLQQTRTGSRREWRTSVALNSHSQVPLAAASSAQPAEAKYSDALVEAVSWFWTEGAKQSTGPSVITQSIDVNPVNVARIERALTGVFGPATVGGRVTPGSVAWRRYERYGKADFWLSKAATAVLEEHAPGRVPTQEFYANCTVAQLELAYTVAMLADNNGEFALSQKSRARAESFLLLCVLTGRATGLAHEPPGPTTPQGMWRVSVRKRQVATPLAVATGSASRVEWVEYTGMVWCPTTQHGTWLARRNGRVYFTGNSSSFAQDSDVVLGLQEDDSDEAMRELRVVMSRNCGRISTRLIWDWATSQFEEPDAEDWGV